MQTAPQIEFQGMAPREGLRDVIRERIAELEQRYGRITSCRVVLKAPGGHHQSGGLYETHIHLGLPDGRSVHVGRTPKADERHGDVIFALHDAFRRARRRLQDEARRLRGDVKTHEPAPLATVARIDREAGFGFLRTPDGREVYFHRNSVLDGHFKDLEPGNRVAFAEEEGEKGPQASTVRLMRKHGLKA